jgi:hypothetical protein
MKTSCSSRMTHFKQFLTPFVVFTVSFSLLWPSMLLANDLRPFDAQYVAFRSGNDIGTASLKLQTAVLDEAQGLKTVTEPTQVVSDSTVFSGHYSLIYQSKVKRFFLSDRRFEKTYFKDNANTLIPISYEYRRTGTGPDKSLNVEFNAADQKIVIDRNESLEWEGELDNQLFRIDLANKLAQGITETHYNFINTRGQKRRYELTVVATENISLPYGQLDALKVKINRESNSRVTYAWFAPSLNYNLVRLQQFKDGKEQGDIQLRQFTYLE